MKTSLLICAFCVFFVQAAGGHAAEASVQTLIARGDSAYDAFDNETALQLYQRAQEADSSNCEVLWKLARAHVDVGESAGEELQRQHYTLAEQIDRRAVELCPDNADAHLGLAIAVGRVALLEGGKKKVRLSREVKAEAEKALELDPNMDIAHHVLARWHREVANLSGLLKMFAKVLYGGLPPASHDTAVEHFQKAIELNPTYINHHLELGITYEDMKMWAEAAESYSKVAELPESDSGDAGHKEEAAQRLLKVSKKLD